MHGAAPEAVRPEFDLAHYWRVLVRRRWVVTAAVLSVFAVAAVKTFRTIPTYRAAVTIQIERVDPNIMRFQEVLTYDPSFLSYQDYYQTQYRLISSRAVASRTVRRLGLASDPGFMPASPPGALTRLWRAVTNPLRSRGGDDAEGDRDPDRPFVDVLLAGLRVDPIKNSHLVEVAFISRSPELAAKVANGVADAYMTFGMETKVDTSETAQDFLTRQIGVLRKEVADLERATQVYGESKEIIPTGTRENTTLSALEDLQRAYTQAQADRAEKEGALTAVRMAPDSGLPQVAASPLVQALTSDVAQLERDHSEMAKTFKPEWPALARLLAKLDQARDRLHRETEEIAMSARHASEAAYRAARERETNLAALLDQQKRVALKLSSDSIEYTNLRSEASKKRETLDQLLKRQSEIALSSHLKDVRSSNTRVIDLARVPLLPYKPNKTTDLLLGLITGLGLGVGMAFLIEYLDNSIKSPEEVSRITGYATFGLIPEHRRAGPRPLRKGTSHPDGEPLIDLVTHLDSRSPLAEAYKELRTATLLASPDQPPRTILITSCLPEEGKSQTCLNLAIALAQAGRRILLVDTDLRRPRLHAALGLANDAGISTYLSGNAEVEQLVQRTTVPSLDILTSGPIPPNPSELLGSRNFLALVRDFAGRGSYDHLIFDSPPVLSVADPVVMATVLDGTILVVRCGRTPREALGRGAGKLRQSNVRVLGVVLNGVSRQDRSYPYQTGYSAGPPRTSEEERRSGTSA